MASVQSQTMKRDQVRIAIICALHTESGRIETLLDTTDRVGLGKHEDDKNSYLVGLMSGHKVVIAYMAGEGNKNAAIAAANLTLSFRKIEVAFVVGICGVVPFHPHTGEEIVLGDVVVSTAAIQTDHGRTYDTGFQRKSDLEDSLGRPSEEIGMFLHKLQSEENLEYLSAETKKHLDYLTLRRKSTRYPIDKKDRLFQADYAHMHHQSSEICRYCLPELKTCREHCERLGCDDEFLVPRVRLEGIGPPLPKIYFGRFGTSNNVLRSGAVRDRFAEHEQILAFEMEGGGVWPFMKTIIIKSACDYADAHKNKDFQLYAAAAAAAALKAILGLWDAKDEPKTQPDSSTNPPNQEPNAKQVVINHGSYKRYDMGDLYGPTTFN